MACSDTCTSTRPPARLSPFTVRSPDALVAAIRIRMAVSGVIETAIRIRIAPTGPLKTAIRIRMAVSQRSGKPVGSDSGVVRAAGEG